MSDNDFMLQVIGIFHKTLRPSEQTGKIGQWKREKKLTIEMMQAKLNARYKLMENKREKEAKEEKKKRKECHGSFVGHVESMTHGGYLSSKENLGRETVMKETTMTTT